MKRKLLLTIFTLLGSVLILAACGGSDTQENGTTSMGTPAMVDGVSVEVKNNHYYAIVIGNYPDSCTRISDVEQGIDGDIFTIVLSTDKPADLVCAQMITPFAVDIILETGGLMPGEYTVDVNGITTAFTLGQ